MQQLFFQDFEAFAQSVQDAELRCMLPRLQQRYWMIQQLTAGSIHLQYSSEGSGNIAEGSTRSDGCVIFCQRSGSSGRANGVQLAPGSLVFMGPRAEFHLTFDNAHDWFSVFVPRELLSSILPDDQGSQEQLRGLKTYQPDSIALQRLQETVDKLNQTAVRQPELLKTPEMTALVQSELLKVFIAALPRHSQLFDERTGRPVMSRQGVVRRVRELLENHQDLCLTSEDMVTATDVSERTLRSVFREYFGMPPIAYLRLRRLHQARTMLQTAPIDQTSVSTVAASIGYWDFGRFADSYRKVFGESPSQTLRRRSAG